MTPDSVTTAQLQCLEKGGPFKIVHVPKSSLAPDQVLIQQRVVALNGLDWKQRDSGIMVSRWPHVLGFEGAGVVEAVGSGVKSLQVGDEVTGMMGGRAHGEDWGGSFQEHVVMPERYVAKRPKNISLEEAASLPICYNTAVCAIYQLGLEIPIANIASLTTSERVPNSILILGGSSSVGAAAIQLLRLSYPSLPIFATSSTSHHARLASLGATELFDYRSVRVVSDIIAASPGAKGVDMIIDCVAAGARQGDICSSLNSSGSKKYAAVISGVTVPVPDGITRFDISGWSVLDMPDGEKVIPALTELIECGRYRVPLPVKVVGHGLGQIPDVMDQVKNVSGTKLVVAL